MATGSEELSLIDMHTNTCDVDDSKQRARWAPAEDEKTALVLYIFLGKYPTLNVVPHNNIHIYRRLARRNIFHTAIHAWRNFRPPIASGLSSQFR